MMPEEHIAEARDSALTADRLFQEDKHLQGAEITWCSVKHAINAIAVQRGWKFNTYAQKRLIVAQIELTGYDDLLEQLEIVRMLHVYSDTGVMRRYTISDARTAAAVLSQRLLAIAESGG